MQPQLILHLFFVSLLGFILASSLSLQPINSTLCCAWTQWTYCTNIFTEHFRAHQVPFYRKVYCSAKFIYVLLPIYALCWHKQTPVSIIGASCLLFFVSLASELHWVHSFHSIKKCRERRHGWEWKIGVLFYLEKSRTHLSLSLSLSLSLAVCVLRQSWNGSPQHRTASLFITTAALTHLFWISHWTLPPSGGEIWESLLVSWSRMKSVWSHTEMWDSVRGLSCDCGHVEGVQ